MAQPHASSGQVIHLTPYGSTLAQFKTTALLKADHLELVRVVLPAGRSLREHSTPGEITVLCLEGCIEFTSSSGLQVLQPGDLIHLSGGEPHALHAPVDASALVTICLVKASAAGGTPEVRSPAR